MIKRYSPAPGSDDEFEALWDKASEALKSAGSDVTEEEGREKLARAFVKHGGRTWQLGADLDRVDELLDQALDSNQGPRVLRIPTAPAEPYWYEAPEDAEFIEHYVMSRRALGSRVHGGLLITGPSGQGKTMSVSHAIERINKKHDLSINLLVMDCATITDPQKWFGRREIDEHGSRYEKSDFILAVERGDAILLDEAWRIHPHIGNGVMSLLAGHEKVTLSDLNITITRHPETVFFATANQGAAFGGNHRQDYAMEERWPFRLERGFPPEAEEIEILVRNNPDCDRDAASVLVTIASATRKMWETGDLRAPISTRTLDNAAFLVASGMTEREALERTALGLYEGGADHGMGSESERTKVARVIEGAGR